MAAITDLSTPPRGFPVAEFETRTANAQRAMAERSIDVMLLTTEPEVRYFTGFKTLFWLSPTRPWFVVVPAAGKPVAIIPSIGDSLMSSTWIDDVRVWSSPNPDDDGVSLLVEALRELGGANATIGTPMGPETHIRMPAADFENVRSQLGDANWVDTTDIVSGLRMVKSENEIAKVAHVCRIVSDAFDGLPNLISIGDTEQQAFAKFRIDILQRGADDVPYLVGSTGPGGFDDIIKSPTDRVIGDGDLLLFDTGSVYDGYFSDFDRNFAFGSADDAAKRAYEVVWRSTEAGLAAVKPGATTSDLWSAMMRVIDEEGSPSGKASEAATPKNSVGRMGHGLGMQVTEWPSHTASDDTVLQEGMVLTLEPGYSWAPGKMMVHEENLVVRADGAELLSRRAAPELPVLA